MLLGRLPQQFLHCPQCILIKLGLVCHMENSTPIPEASPDMIATLAGYGLFMVNWSLFEATIEVAIQKRLELHPIEGNIVTGGLAFLSRSSILRSLLALDDTDDAKEASTLINSMVNDANRNAIIHGIVHVGGDHTLKFVHRKTANKLTAKSVIVDKDSMLSRASTLRKSIEKLQSLLSVSNEELQEFGNIGQLLANKSST
jgi:hypothetical protein